VREDEDAKKTKTSNNKSKIRDRLADGRKDGREGWRVRFCEGRE
jgi:hypothetical protein